MRRPVSEQEARQLMAAQSGLAEDLRVIEAFGARIPDVWTGVRYEGPDLVVLMTDPDAQRDALLHLVAHPDRVEVRQASYSRATLDAVYREALEIAGPDPRRFVSHGPGLERVGLELRSTEHVLAAELHERFGDAVEIHLGNHPYPLAGAPTRPQAAPRSTVKISGLQLVALPDREAWASGETITGDLRLVNTSRRERIRLDTGQPATGVLVDAGGAPVAGYTGWIAGTGRLVDLEPEGETTIAFLAGSDTFDPALGAALPAGDYSLVVTLEIGGASPPPLLVAPSVDIRIQ